MIKAGIYGSDTIVDPVRKQLLRLLLRHPDIDLRAVASPAGNTVPIAQLHPVFTGETELTLERVLKLDDLDVLFVIDEENLTDEILERYHVDSNLRLIILGNTPTLLADPGEFVYGLPELTRKALVRGARGAVSPRPEAMLIELALLPLAKNMLLNAPISLTISSKNALAPAVDEAVACLKTVQPTFEGRVSAEASTPPPYGRLDLTASIDTPIAIEEIERLYREAYDDHSFVHTVDGTDGIDEDLRGSNKCLIQLMRDGNTLTIRASLDALTKGRTGNAVHILDLLFGLHERTGLSI